MKEEIKRELSIWLQYFAIVLVSIIIGFVAWLSSIADENNQPNLIETWKQLKPYNIKILIVFVILSSFRFALIILNLYVKHKKHH